MQNIYEHDTSVQLAESVTPLRISQCGANFRALLEADVEPRTSVPMAVDSSTMGGAVYSADSARDDDRIGQDAHLCDLKDSLDGRLSDVLALIDEIVEWSRGLAGEPYDFSEQRQQIESLRTRLKNGTGLDAAMLGFNGIGKSTIANLLMLNSSIQDGAYSNRPVEYVPEALQYKMEEPPSLVSLSSSETKSLEAGVISVVHLSPEDPTDADRFTKLRHDYGVESDEAAAKANYEAAEASIREHCERASDVAPALENFVLPCSSGGKTNTAVNTRVRFGSLVHMLVEMYTIEELQDQAFKFVTLRRNLEAEGRDEFELLYEEEKSYLAENWHLYLNITNGPYPEKELPELEQMFEWVPSEDVPSLPATVNDVPVCDAMKTIVASPVVLYLPPGKSIYLDRVLVHDMLARFQDKDSLYHYAIKSLETFQPSAVLEGGNGIMDLPGHEVNTRCQQQTREGVKEAGVVFVVLKKSVRGDKDTLAVLERADTYKRVVAGEANVVFLFNREIGPKYVRGQLCSESETEIVETAVKETREEWLKKLKSANLSMKKSGGAFKSDEEIVKIAEETPMRAIYPMIHTSLRLNWRWTEQHKEEEAAILKHSNVHWLLGILEALNRQSIVEAFKFIATEAMPSITDYLTTKLQDVQSLQTDTATQLPQNIVDKARKLLVSKNTKTGAIWLQSDMAVEMVQDLFSRVGLKRKAGGSSFDAADDPMVHGTRSLKALGTASSADVLPDGTQVLIEGIVAKPELNGKRGCVTGRQIDRSGVDRHEVTVEGGQKFALRRSCLVPIEAAGSAAGNSDALAAGSTTSASPESRSYRLQLADTVRNFLQEHGQAYLAASRESSARAWEHMQKQLTNPRLAHFATALRVIDPRNKGNLHKYSLLPVVFGDKAGKKELDIDFEPLLTSLNEKLQALLEDVVEKAVVKGVDALLLSDGSHISTVILKEGFIESDVLQKLKQRFSIHAFLGQSEGNSNKFLRRTAAQQLERAVHTHILAKNNAVKELNDVMQLIDDGREPARQAWLTMCQDKIEGIVIGQLDQLCKQLMHKTSRGKAISVQSLLTSFLQYIVNADTITKSVELQNELHQRINLHKQKTDSLHSLWARVDWAEEPTKLGEAAAQQVERRRMRELTVQTAKSISHFIGSPDRPMHSQGLHPQHSNSDKLFDRYDASHVFAGGDADEMLKLSHELKKRYGLDLVLKRSPTSSVGFADIFSAVALLAYTPTAIRRARGTTHEHAQDTNEQIKLAGLQLRAVTAAEISTYYSDPKRSAECERMTRLLGESIEAYIDRVRSPSPSGGELYSGDLLCIYFISRFLKRNFRVWLPGQGSLFVPHNYSTENGRSAYNLFLTADPPCIGPAPATAYQACCCPTQRTSSLAKPRAQHRSGGGGSSFGGGGRGDTGSSGRNGGSDSRKARRMTVRFAEAANDIKEIAMSDEEVEARKGSHYPNGQPRHCLEVDQSPSGEGSRKRPRRS